MVMVATSIQLSQNTREKKKNEEEEEEKQGQTTLPNTFSITRITSLYL